MASVVILVLVGLGVLCAGFLVGRYYVPDDRTLKRQARRSDAYVRAINHVLAADLGAAEVELKALVQSENVEDIEPYFALGALLRRRGQWEPAARIHQAIKMREGHSKKVRQRAHYELGLDFCRAGMPRKATRAMEACLDDDSRHEGALRALCFLYEEQGRYADAADAWRRLAKVRDVPLSGRFHHLLVAAAQDAVRKGDADAGKRLLREARRVDDTSPHALVAAAELARLRANPKGATARIEEVLEQVPELARVLVPELVGAQRELAAARWHKEHGKQAEEDAEAAALLDEQAAQMAVAALERVLEKIGRNGHVEMAVADVRSHYDAETALEEYRRIGDAFPELLPARMAAARLALASEDAGEMRRELHALVAGNGVLTWAMEGAWRCRQCGARSHAFVWRCRACRRWDSLSLDVGRELVDEAQPRPRALPRGGVDVALLGAATSRALPEPTLDSDSDSEAADSETGDPRASVLGLVGGWFADTWSGLRSKPGPSREAARALPQAEPEATAEPEPTAEPESTAEPEQDQAGDDTSKPAADDADSGDDEVRSERDQHTSA